MLLNLSNHPLSSWTENQISYAEKYYGKVVDLEFPQIPPDADEDLITALANDYKEICLDILSSSKDITNAVHIMGELTFCFALVNELKKINIKCVASTTDRNSYELNGMKVSNFNFVRFREY